MKNLILMAMVLVWSAPCTGANFVNIMKRSTEDGMMVAIDVTSVINRGNGIIELWAKHTFETPQIFLRGPASVETRYWVQLEQKRIDCRNRRSMTLYVVVRGKRNEILTSDAVDKPRWEPVPPETVRETTMLAGCSRDYPQQQR